MKKLRSIGLGFKEMAVAAAIILCFAFYFITNNYQGAPFREVKISYRFHDADSIEMVWGVNDWKTPDTSLLPANTYIEEGLAHTPMNFSEDEFCARLRLPIGIEVNYLFVVVADADGRPANDWHDNDGRNYFLRVNHPVLRPGFFLLLAGLIILGYFFFTTVKKQIIVQGELHREFLGKYVTQFDAIRAIAVLLVMFHHWLPEDHFLNTFDNGAIGVNIFFVLSGFLITKILLEKKDEMETAGTSGFASLWNFVVRRSLRIFPIYYLLMLVLFLLNDPVFLRHAEYYLTYTSNYLFYSKQNFLGHLSHVWTLAVEEQFYLVWPWLILFLNRKYLIYIIWLFIIIGITTNYIINDHGWWSLILTPACFDAFGMGALLSFVIVFRNDWVSIFRKYLKVALVLALVLVVINHFYTFFPNRTLHSVIALAMFDYCLFDNGNRFFNIILRNRFLIFMGRISYGIYLYHLFVPYIWRDLQSWFGERGIDFLFNNSVPQIIRNEWIFLQEWAFVLAVSWISWIIIEKPINGLKRWFE